VVNSDISTCIGITYLDGDYENSSTADGDNSIRFDDGRTVTSKTLLTLESTTGDIKLNGVLTLKSGTGVVILDNMNSEAAGRAVVINADYESAGDGTLTVVSTKTVTSNNGAVTITAWDVDLAGSLTAGSGGVSVHGAQVNQTFGLGGSSQNMHITDAELGRMTTAAGLTVGTSASGSIVADGITDGSSDAIATLTLIATKHTRLITFKTGASSFNKGVVLQAMGGVVLSESVTTKQQPVLIRTGTGTLTVQSTKTLSTTGQLLNITADDLDFKGAVSSGTAAMNILSTSADLTIGLGATTKDMQLTDSELALISTVPGLTIGAYSVRLHSVFNGF
jgi:hypothetical protein